ncbi:MAG: hypothetical protein GY795_44395, partial [Desulfobacterales bacterium]|nr:hypothetical protein [Desulfobacterales bacterium]
MKKTISTFLIYFLLLSSYAIAGESELITLIDFGVSENSNIYEFSDWTAPVKDVYTDYYDIGPGGTSVAVGNNGSYNYQGVQGGDTEFKAGEKITVTWYNNSDTAVSFIPRISFDDPNRQGSYEPTGDWYDMNEITISPNTGGQTVFEFDDSSAGIYSLVNVSMTYNVEKEVLICDKIELAWTENQGLITYDGGTVSSDDGLVTVIFPQGSVHENVFITIFPLVGCTIPFKSDFEFISTVYKIIAENEQGQLVNNFNKDIEITIKYDPDAIRGLNEENFEIDYYDETENQWITLTSKINLVNYTLTTTTDYPGEFAILAGTAPETAVRKIDLRKNPNKLRHLFPNTMEDLKNNPVIVLDDYNELKIVSITEDSSDSGYVKYRQYFRGVPLQGFQVTVALMSDGELKIRGFLMEGIDLHIRDVTPALDEDTALVSMKSRHRQDNGITADLNYRNERCELIIYTDEENAAYLTYEVSFFA